MYKWYIVGFVIVDQSVGNFATYIKELHVVFYKCLLERNWAICCISWSDLKVNSICWFGNMATWTSTRLLLLLLLLSSTAINSCPMTWMMRICHDLLNFLANLSQRETEHSNFRFSCTAYCTHNRPKSSVDSWLLSSSSSSCNSRSIKLETRSV